MRERLSSLKRAASKGPHNLRVSGLFSAGRILSDEEPLASPRLTANWASSEIRRSFHAEFARAGVFSRDAPRPKERAAAGWRKATIINAALGSKIGWASYLGNRLLCLASNRGSARAFGSPIQPVGCNMFVRVSSPDNRSFETRDRRATPPSARSVDFPRRFSPATRRQRENHFRMTYIVWRIAWRTMTFAPVSPPPPSPEFWLSA